MAGASKMNLEKMRKVWFFIFLIYRNKFLIANVYSWSCLRLFAENLQPRQISDAIKRCAFDDKSSFFGWYQLRFEQFWWFFKKKYIFFYFFKKIVFFNFASILRFFLRKDSISVCCESILCKLLKIFNPPLIHSRLQKKRSKKFTLIPRTYSKILQCFWHNQIFAKQKTILAIFILTTFFLFSQFLKD